MSIIRLMNAATGRTGRALAGLVLAAAGEPLAAAWFPPWSRWRPEPSAAASPRRCSRRLRGPGDGRRQMAALHRGRGERPGTRNRDAFPRPERLLPRWRSALVVVAHPDDETFGLGALIDRLTVSGAAVHVLCFTRGEASTLNENDSDLLKARARELRQAASVLGVAAVTMLDYPDGRLAGTPPPELAAHVTRLARRHRPDGLLVFDDTGITCHPDHQAATRAAVHAAAAAGLPVLAWVLPDAIAGRLRAETGGAFAGQPADDIDLCVRVDRAAQRKAALMHASQISPTAVLWRRLQLQGDREHLRWLSRPGTEA